MYFFKIYAQSQALDTSVVWALFLRMLVLNELVPAAVRSLTHTTHKHAHTTQKRTQHIHCTHSPLALTLSRQIVPSGHLTHLSRRNSTQATSIWCVRPCALKPHSRLYSDW